MKKLNYLTILWIFALMACAPDKNTKNTQQQTEYIINPPDFEELERKKTERAQGISPNKANGKPSLSKEDSIKAYIKELTHHFHLQEKQIKALEYIYAKYDKKELSIKSGDTARLVKLNTEKEKSIAVVLGENYYARKGAFDEKYIKKNTKVKPKVPSKKVLKYVSLLTKELKLKQYQIDTIKNVLMRSEDNATKIDSFSVTQLNKKSNLIIEQVLNKSLLSKKEVFDKNYKD